MGWAEKRLDAYQHGGSARWIELRALEHANTVHIIIRIVAVSIFIVGLWMHSWPYIGLGFLLAVLGHAYCWTR